MDAALVFGFQEQRFRTPSACESLFFARPQRKVTKRKRPSSTRQTGRFIDARIFRLALLARSENGVHPCTPPDGSVGRRRVLPGVGEPTTTVHSQELICNPNRQSVTKLELAALGRCLALHSNQSHFASRRPEGRRTGSAPFSDRAMDGESENPRVSSDQVLALSKRALSFGYFSLGSAKKSGSRAEGVRKAVGPWGEER